MPAVLSLYIRVYNSKHLYNRHWHTIIDLKKSRTFVSKTSLSSISSVVLGRGGRHKKGNPAGNETTKAESDCNYMRNEEIGKVCI